MANVPTSEWKLSAPVATMRRRLFANITRQQSDPVGCFDRLIVYEWSCDRLMEAVPDVMPDGMTRDNVRRSRCIETLRRERILAIRRCDRSHDFPARSGAALAAERGDDHQRCEPFFHFNF